MNEINTPYNNISLLPVLISEAGGSYSVGFGKRYISNVTKNATGDITIELKHSARQNLLGSFTCIDASAKIFAVIKAVTTSSIRIAIFADDGTATDASVNGAITMINQGLET